MEGLAGIVYPDVFQMNHQIHPMLDIMRYQKSSLGDAFLHKNFQIGIIGAKLAYNEKKTVVLALNGTLTNREELNEELKKQGCSLHSNDHAHLIISAYELWGIGCIAKLSGDFALAIFDQHKERVLLARDRIGAKSLYWFQDQHHFIFASELKALLATGAVPQTPSEDALASYFYFGYIPQDMTPIKNVNKLLPGHFLQFNRDKSIFIQPFWSYSSFFEKKNTDSKNHAFKNFHELLVKSVKSRLPRNESVGCLIMGGLGSACVAQYAKKLGPCNQFYAFSAGFQGQNDPDIKAAAEIAKILQMPYKVETITASNFLDNLVTISWYLDEPLSDPNVIAIWKMAKAAAQNVKKVFSGMGSDELLAGHSRYTEEERHVNLSTKVLQCNVKFLRSFLIPALNHVYPALAYYLLKKSRTNPRQFEYLRHNAIFNEHLMAAASPKLAGLFDPEVFLHKFHNLERIKSIISSYLYFDVKTRLTDCYILQLKRLTCAHNLDWQTPFLDHHLFEYIAGLQEPDRLAESETAAYLKLLLKDQLPGPILNRPKRTRSNFLSAWANEPEMKQIWDLLAKGTLVEMGIISPAWLNVQIETPYRCEKSFKLLWSILMLEIWFRLYINRPLPLKAPEISVRDFLIES